MKLTSALLLVLSVTSASAFAQAPAEHVEYYAIDGIGSVRAVFASDGTLIGRGDFTPFGEELPNANLPPERFTAQARDPEAGLDYFHARYYPSRLGRFNVVDPIFADALEDPQRWNRYAYALNNPLSETDPDGLTPKYQDSVTVTANVLYWPVNIELMFLGAYGGYYSSGPVRPAPVAGGRTKPTPAAETQQDPAPPPAPSPQPPPPSPPTPGPAKGNQEGNGSLVSTLKSWIPSVCGGGLFGYGAAALPIVPGLFGVEDVAIIEYDSQEGGSHGGLLGLEVGPAVVGVEAMRTWHDWKEHIGPIGIAGGEFSAASRRFGKRVNYGRFDAGGFVNWMDRQLSIGGYLGGNVFGGGAYMSLSWNACRP